MDFIIDDYDLCGNGTHIITRICRQDVRSQQISDFVSYVLYFLVIYIYLAALYIRDRFF